MAGKWDHSVISIVNSSGVDCSLVTKPWTMISRIQVLWRYAHSSKLQEFNKLARTLTKYCGGPSSSPLVRSYLMLSAVGLLIAESVVPTIHNVEDLEGSYFDNPALEAYQHALEIQPRILAQCILPRIQQYLWTFYIGQPLHSPTSQTSFSHHRHRHPF